MEVIRAKNKLGPGYVNNFQYHRESDVLLTAAERRELYTSGLHSSILFNYNSKACEGATCLESSPSQSLSFFVHSPHATMLHGASPVNTKPIQEALLSSGGVQVGAILKGEREREVVVVVVVVVRGGQGVKCTGNLPCITPHRTRVVYVCLHTTPYRYGV